MLLTQSRTQNTPSAQQVRLIHQFVERQVNLSPHAIAIKTLDQSCTYQALNEKANRLAHFLQSLGVGSDTLVGVCIDRSIDLIIAVLAVLKSGGAYLPLDPAYPKERLGYMLEQAQVSVVLTQSHWYTQLPLQNQKTILLDKQGTTLANFSVENPTSTTTENSLGYVIYTSGSTGKPKGVSMPHGPLVNLIRWQIDNSQVTAGNTLQFTPISFDVSFQEIFSTLAVGGTLILITDEQRRDPYHLLKVLEQEAIERLFLPFVALQHLAEVATSTKTHHLKLKEVITAGEQLRITPALVEWFSQMPGCSLHNHYGPSESHVVTAYCLEDDPQTWPLLPPIGAALPHVQIHLLDETLQPVIAGEVGEIYIGGECLAREYLHRPDLTAERFIPCPAHLGMTGYLYKTGDLARCLPEGVYEYLGRSDQQIKIRGYRIEPGEIEAQLEQHPAVLEAIVIAREDHPGQKKLIGYTVVKGPNHPWPEGPQILRQFLQGCLPDYMVPSAIVCLEAFPLTPSGKVDRRNLPVPTQPAFEHQYIAPQSALEKTLARIWEAVLEVDRVGLEDNFFDLGGHSLLATQVMIRIRATLQYEVPFSQFFETPQLGAFATWLATASTGTEPDTLRLQSLPRTEAPPLAWMQEPLWFLDQLMVSHPFYTVPEAFRLQGPLDISALARSLQTLMDRHETLRTTFKVIEGRPVQVIHEQADCPFSSVDLSQLPAETQALEVQSQLVAAARLPFDLTREMLFRATLFTLGETEHILLLNLHHIICDGWSISVLMRELDQLYQAFEASQPPSLKPLPVQYADFALWHRQWLTAERCEQQLTYWQQHLGDGVPRLTLPTDFSRPVRLSYEGKRHFLTLPNALTQRLKDLGQASETTLYMVLLAAFQTLLYRYSGQEDFAVGSLLANRPCPELEGLIGFFPNTVALRANLSGSPSFRDLLQRVRKTTLGAYAHQDLPFDQIVRTLHPDHNPGQNPFFQVLFNLQNTPVANWQHPELSLTHLQLDNKTTKFDLFLELTEVESGLTGYFEYSTDLFKPETIERLVGHFLTLLGSIVDHPDRSVAELSLFTQAEQQQLSHWNQTKTDYPRQRCLHELIEAQVQRTPDAIAIEFQHCTLSYDALNQRVNQCARYLRALGVRPGTLVGVFMERSADLVIALLAVLKAGGAYVPLDPIYPPERLSLMIEDSELSVFITQSSLQPPSLPPEIQVVCVDQDWSKIAQYSSANLKIVNSSEDLAYTIYTSGSTGKPKGVQIQHRALVNFLWSMKEAPGLTSEDVLVAVTTICFDIAGLELYLPLMVGAKIVLASRETASDPQQLAQLLTTSKATIMQATPATWRMLLATGWSGHPQLKLLCGGEPLPRDLADQLLAKGKSLWNLYGPTETTIWSTVYQVEPGRNPVPIGHPIGNTQIYLLNSVVHNQEILLQPVPVGLVGELYIGGDGLAKGYLNRPELTQEKFIPNPFSLDSDDRLYRTGDLARYLPDGALECLGRIDHQVKIRGFRIELGDIETALSQHPAIRAAVVVAQEVQTGDKQLVAYVVADETALTPDIPSKAQTRQWQTIWDETYRQSSADVDPTFNITGWTNSYTGQPMPEIEMREWVSHTIQRILALSPERVLEIGCGTGLLLYRIAPHCKQYQGIDLSPQAIQSIQEQLQAQPVQSKVQLSVGAADHLLPQDLEGVDTVILNSVVQYFPSIEYLVNVLDLLLNTLQSGSRIFLGDIRNLALLEQFHTAIQLFQAKDSLTLEQLNHRIQERLAQESELLIDPRFFGLLKQRYDKIGRIDIQLKRGQYHNELTQFRYDAVIHVGSVPDPNIEPIILEWHPRLDVKALGQQLGSQPSALLVKQIPNTRLLSTCRAMTLLHQPNTELTTVADLKADLQRQGDLSGLDPEELWLLGEALGYQVSITGSQDNCETAFDAMFQRF